MREWPDSRVVADLLAQATRLRTLQTAAGTLALGLVLATPFVLLALLNGVTVRSALLAGLAVGATCAVIAWARVDRTERASAAAIEAKAPHCHNVIVTAAGLLKDPGHTPRAVCRVVMSDAAAVTRTLNPAALMPWARPAGHLIGGAAIFASTFLVSIPGTAALLPGMTSEASSAPSISNVRATITPPAYTGLHVETVSNPERLDAQAGSQVALVIAAGGTRMSIETAEETSFATRNADGDFALSMVVTADGFVTITPFDDAGVAGPRRLIGITSTPDRPPVPRVTLPGKDLFLREATEQLKIAVDATDDLGLRSLKLAYTKVAGVGESFTFTEGETPLSIARASDRQWSGSGTIDLAAMSLEVGDMIVYRAVAADARPGARPIESDAFIVEIVSASEAMAEGFSIDDTSDKYALSQQMVILKTERLIAKTFMRPAPSADDILEEAMMIAAEQRSVRAELVFMTGGHFEDEFVEAAHEHEISDGRLDNSGRADLGRAIREMSRASAELTEGNVKVALDAEKAALTAMQRALSRRRFILRTLTQREAIDDTRRLTGTLADLARARRATADPEVPASVVALRQGLAHLGELAAKPMLSRTDADAVTAVTAQLLKTAAGERAIVDVVAVLSKAGELMTATRQQDARAALADAANRMTALLRKAAPSSAAGDGRDRRRLKGALADALKRGGKR